MSGSIIQDLISAARNITRRLNNCGCDREIVRKIQDIKDEIKTLKDCDGSKTNPGYQKLPFSN